MPAATAVQLTSTLVELWNEEIADASAAVMPAEADAGNVEQSCDGRGRGRVAYVTAFGEGVWHRDAAWQHACEWVCPSPRCGARASLGRAAAASGVDTARRRRGRHWRAARAVAALELDERGTLLATCCALKRLGTDAGTSACRSGIRIRQCRMRARERVRLCARACWGRRGSPWLSDEQGKRGHDCQRGIGLVRGLPFPNPPACAAAAAAAADACTCTCLHLRLRSPGAGAQGLMADGSS